MFSFYCVLEMDDNVDYSHLSREMICLAVDFLCFSKTIAFVSVLFVKVL